MSPELILLLTSGTLAALGGAVIILMSPSRLAALLAGVSLLLLGLQQLGWARAIDAISWGMRNYWFDLSFVFALPVSLAWLLLSVTLGRGEGPERFRGWRVFVPLQAVLSLAAVAGLHWFSPVGRLLTEDDERGLPLTPFGACVLGNLLLNVTLLTANFESTYLAFSARWKRAFRPALLSVVFAGACYGYLFASSVLLGRLSLWEVTIASIPIAVVSVVLPSVLIRRRIAEASVTAALRPFHETGSFVLGALLLGILVVLVQVARFTGWTLVRTAWVSILCVALVGLAAVTLSSRLQRLLQRLLEPYLYTSRFDPEAVSSLLSSELDRTRTRKDLYSLIPSMTVEIAGVEPVTLFMTQEGGSDFVVVGSTLDPAPSECVARDEPLARELRASRHAIHLRGRSDDLDLIPIYVENAKAIAACEAVSAVPLRQRGRLLGFLLCGDPERGVEKPAATLLLLEVIAQMLTARLTSPERDR